MTRPSECARRQDGVISNDLLRDTINGSLYGGVDVYDPRGEVMVGTFLTRDIRAMAKELLELREASTRSS